MRPLNKLLDQLKWSEWPEELMNEGPDLFLFRSHSVANWKSTRGDEPPYATPSIKVMRNYTLISNARKEHPAMADTLGRFCFVSVFKARKEHTFGPDDEPGYGVKGEKLRKITKAETPIDDNQHFRTGLSKRHDKPIHVFIARRAKEGLNIEFAPVTPKMFKAILKAEWDENLKREILKAQQNPASRAGPRLGVV
jgi:hypothetical protein